MKRFITLVISVALALAPTAMAAVHRFYEGPPRPAAEIAVLGGDHFNLVSVDGQKPPRGKYFGSGWSDKFSIELLPGSHVLEADVVTRGFAGRDSLRVPITFLAEAGHAYAIEGGEILSGYSTGGGGSVTTYTGKWKVTITDLTTGTKRSWGSEPEPAPRLAIVNADGTCPLTGGALVLTTEVVKCKCTASLTHDGWGVSGTDIYHPSSVICRAAVHAGVIGPTGGEVAVRSVPGIQSYQGTVRNGVRSEDAAARDGGFRFEQAAPSEPPKEKSPR